MVIQPSRKGLGALIVDREDLAVCPFGLQGAVVSLNLAVMPGTMSFVELLPDVMVFVDFSQGPPVAQALSVMNRSMRFMPCPAK